MEEQTKSCITPSSRCCLGCLSETGVNYHDKPYLSLYEILLQDKVLGAKNDTQIDNQ